MVKRSGLFDVALDGIEVADVRKEPTYKSSIVTSHSKRVTTVQGLETILRQILDLLMKLIMTRYIRG